MRWISHAFSWTVALQCLATPTAGATSPAVLKAVGIGELWLQERIAYEGFPGVNVCVIHGTDVLWSGAYGHEDADRKRPMTVASLFRIGSVTKTLTSVAVMQLSDRGKLALHDPVEQHVIGFRVKNPFQGPTLTIEQLLTHTSGLPRDLPFPAWTTHEFPDRGTLLSGLGEQSLISPPGETYAYSNLGMTLLGLVIEDVSGQPYADYLQKNIFSPLAMKHSTAKPSNEMQRRLVVGYMPRRPDGTRRAYDYYDLKSAVAAGGVVSTVEDLARFAAYVMGNPLPGSEPVLKAHTLRQMQRPHFLASWNSARGLGFTVSEEDGETVVSHGGSIGGHRCHLRMVPKNQLAVVACTNSDDASPYAITPVVHRLVTTALEAADPVASPPSVWNRYVGVYTDPWDWHYEVRILGGELVLYAHDYPPAKEPSDSVTTLKPAGSHRFEMRSGEHLTFELDKSGAVERVKRRFDYLFPVH